MMVGRISRVLAAALLAGAATQAVAQTSGPVPVARDVQRERTESRQLDRRPSVVDRNVVTPGNPGGVAGFDGPPGIVGDSVGSYGPLPPGGPGNESQ